MPDLSPFADFATAAAAVLAHLRGRLGLDVWVVTRTDGANWVVLRDERAGHAARSMDVLRSLESFGFRMARGQGPRIACGQADVPAYRTDPAGEPFPVAAYVAVPLLRGDGALVGTLCGFHPTPLPTTFLDELPEIELLARLLASILEAEQKIEDEARRAGRAETEALTDPLTGLWNRRAWDRLLAAEESRCRRYGHPAGVVSVDLDRLKEVNDRDGHARGDGLLRQTARLLRTSTRSQDVVARLGGDEFAILLVECDRAAAEEFLDRLQTRLTDEGVEASLGVAERNPSAGLADAWEVADRAMYLAKRGRKAAAVAR